MKIACICYTDKGYKLSLKIKEKFEYVDIFKNNCIEGGIKLILPNIFLKYDGIIFVSACGIAVRMIAPYIKSKIIDPAVVVVDDIGKFTISLLSGHIGGANELASKIAFEIGSIPVITTASDISGIESLDMFSKRYDLAIDNMEDVKKVTAIMVNGGTIKFQSDVNCKINYPNICSKNYDAAVYITAFKNICEDKTFALLRPKNLNIGIGCKRGIKGEKIIKAIYEVFYKNNLSVKSIKSISTIDIKKNEEGIKKACEHFKCNFNIFSPSQIDKVKDMFQKSEFVNKVIGVPAVSEPCAYLAGGEVIVNKTKMDGITISVAMEE